MIFRKKNKPDNHVGLGRRILNLLFATNGRKLAWCLLGLALLAHSIDQPIISGVRNQTFDFYQRLSPREIEKNSQIVVIDIDEKSLVKYGQWPWSRSIMAQMVTQLSKMGAVTIAFDIVFAQEDRLSPHLFANSTVGLDATTREKLEKMPGNDGIFANAIKESRVVLGGFVSNRDEKTDEYALKKMASFNWIGPDPKRYVRAARSYVGNLPLIENAATGHSSFSLDSDFDGIIRRIPLISRVNDTLIPALGLEVLRVATGRNAIIRANENGIQGVVIAKTFIPTDGFGRLWIRFSKFNPKRYIPAADLFDGKVSPQDIQGKLVLVGTSATGLRDIRGTPMELVPGVEIHAQMLDTILSGQHLFRSDLMRVIEWSTSLLTGLILIVIVPLAGARWSLAVLVGMMGTAMGSAGYLYSQMSILLDVSFLMSVSTILYILLVYSGFRSVEQQRGQIRNAFSHYLSPDLVNKLTQSPDSLTLGGEVREMTFLFCDIRGFTPISEQYKDDPEGLTHLINAFLTPMTDIIMKHGGTIDKYMGDCIMAFWNAPLDDPDHAKHAAAASLEMHQRLAVLNIELEQQAQKDGRPFLPINVGIGLNTGKCVVGNMGSDQRFDYSVLGDAVNMASRLEGQCKTYGVETIIGERTAEELTGFSLIELDCIAVKGKSHAANIFALLDDESKKSTLATANQENIKFLSLYRSRQWERAKEQAERCRADSPSFSILYDLYLERIGEYKENPPPENWKGVFTATTK